MTRYEATGPARDHSPVVIGYDAIPRARLDLRVRNSGGTISLARKDTVLRLSETAGFLCRSFDGRRSLADIAAMTAREYDVAKEDVLDDLVDLAEQLLEANFIELLEAPPTANRSSP
jgi:hypothetical protein